MCFNKIVVPIFLQNLSEMALTIADPHSLHFLCSTIIQILTENARSCASLPRESTLIHILVRLLYVSLKILWL